MEKLRVETGEAQNAREEALKRDRECFIEEFVKKHTASWPESGVQKLPALLSALGAKMEERFDGKWRSVTTLAIVESFRKDPNNLREDPFADIKSTLLDEGVPFRKSTTAINMFVRGMVIHRTTIRQKGFVNNALLKEGRQEINERTKTGQKYGDFSFTPKIPDEFRYRKNSVISPRNRGILK